jgi:iron complex outermembrane receptor protein
MSSSLAGFGQLTYSPMSNLHITGGIRYTADERPVPATPSPAPMT